jgi:hypothetical protein
MSLNDKILHLCHENYDKMTNHHSFHHHNHELISQNHQVHYVYVFSITILSTIE